MWGAVTLPELVTRKLRGWLKMLHVEPLYIEPGLSCSP